jgi:hypothetical protein
MSSTTLALAKTSAVELREVARLRYAVDEGGSRQRFSVAIGGRVGKVQKIPGPRHAHVKDCGLGRGVLRIQIRSQRDDAVDCAGDEHRSEFVALRAEANLPGRHFCPANLAGIGVSE